MKQVQVLMSTYNGEKYLKEQIDSILEQTDVEVSLLVRDDGSTDGTIKILEEYKRNNKNISWYQGKNIGTGKSFFELLKDTIEGADYYAFADQDDYWFPEKLIKAIERIQIVEGEYIDCPLLYGSNVIYATKDLKKREKYRYKNKKKPTFGNALLENICIGCTQVFNKELFCVVREKQPREKIWHDWWLYLSASCFGQVIYDEEAYILYRQHGENQVGMKNSWCGRWKNRICYFSKLKNSVSLQAQEFINIYGKDYELYLLVQTVAEYKKNWKSKIRLIKNKEIYRQQNIDDSIYKLLFIFGLL